MPTPKKGARLGGSPAHQKLILSNLAVQLIEHRAVTTTEAKAKMLRPYVEKLVTKAKRGDIHARRLVFKRIHNKDAVYMLFDEIVPQLDSERQGGYTRLTRVGNRKGDNAPLMRIEFVLERLEKKAVVAEAEATAAAAEKAPKQKKAKKTEETEEKSEATPKKSKKADADDAPEEKVEEKSEDTSEETSDETPDEKASADEAADTKE
ncbi:MAG: 50S ribosomal protein L17 [Actinobacteria bacterium]|nr:MAG: 50S ribosomal protein L17 [Actinomycetota bacterium]